MKHPMRASTGLVLLSVLAACSGTNTPLDPSLSGGAGTNGAAGVTGAAGASATAGTTGAAGANAAAGWTGSAGTMAATGSAGAAGSTLCVPAANPSPFGLWTPAPRQALWPSARRGPAMVYDLATETVVMYGGYANAFPATDTWQWSGATGSWVGDVIEPPGTFDMFAVAYDTTRRRLLLFAGESFPNASPTNEVWEWTSEGQTWALAAASNMQAPPSPQTNPVGAYDPLRRRVVVYGAAWNEPTRMHAWDPVAHTWSELGNKGGPEGVASSTFVWDPCRDRGVFFGGATGGELWEWKPATGEWALRPAAGALAPSARSGARLTFDTNVNRPLLFGGRAEIAADPAAPSVFDELWQWDGETGTWTNLAAFTPGPHPHRPASGGGVTFDSGRGRLVVFGASDETGFDTADLWEWERN